MAEIKNVGALRKAEVGLRNLFWGSVVSLISVIQLECLDNVQLTINLIASLGIAWCVWGLLRITNAHWSTSLGSYLLCVLMIVILYLADFVFVHVINWLLPLATQNQPFLLGARMLNILRFASYISFCGCMLDLVQLHDLGDQIWRNWLYTLFAIVAVGVIGLAANFVPVLTQLVALLVWLTAGAIAIAFYLGSLRTTFKRIQDLLDGEPTTA